MGLLPSGQFRDVLGLNARTLEYVRRVNSGTASKVANKKLRTKRILQKAGIPTPRLFATITTRGGLQRFRWTKLPSSFVLKPNSASLGVGSTPALHTTHPQ